jgi:phosphoenolpyruvate---glycerone phosphotransferase subunit DhaK
MQKFFNNPMYVVDDMLEGFVQAHTDIVSTTDNEHVLKYKYAPIKGKVGIVTGGGSGHKPAFIGYIGKNMVDAVAVGEIFSSPPAQMFYDAIKAADGGAGVAILYGNYAGDNMNVAMAMELAEEEGIGEKSGS